MDSPHTSRHSFNRKLDELSDLITQLESPKAQKRRMSQNGDGEAVHSSSHEDEESAEEGASIVREGDGSAENKNDNDNETQEHSSGRRRVVQPPQTRLANELTPNAERRLLETQTPAGSSTGRGGGKRDPTMSVLWLETPSFDGEEFDQRNSHKDEGGKGATDGPEKEHNEGTNNEIQESVARQRKKTMSEMWLETPPLSANEVAELEKKEGVAPLNEELRAQRVSHRKDASSPGTRKTTSPSASSPFTKAPEPMKNDSSPRGIGYFPSGGDRVQSVINLDPRLLVVDPSSFAPAPPPPAPLSSPPSSPSPPSSSLSSSPSEKPRLVESLTERDKQRWATRMNDVHSVISVLIRAIICHYYSFFNALLMADCRSIKAQKRLTMARQPELSPEV